MPTQTGSLDLSAQKQAFDISSQTATSYVTDITGGGVFVHPDGDTQSGVAITDAVNIVQDGVSVAEYGSSLRIGKEGEARLSFSGDTLLFQDASGVAVASIAVNELGESVFYMTNAIVMSELNFGEGMWRWQKRDNDNLSLKWLGATGATGATGA